MSHECVETQILRDLRDLRAERDTLKALCVDHIAELEYLYGQTRFNLDDRERWRAMAERARSILA